MTVISFFRVPIPSEADLTESPRPVEAAIEKRRSTRVVRAFPITVIGIDALQEPFMENTSTVMVSCHGCKYQSTHYVPRGSVVELEIAATRRGAPRRVAGKVIWVQRPRNAKDLLHVGLDFELPGNVWDIPAPPRDWFPVPGEGQVSTPETDETSAPCPDTQSLEDEQSADNEVATAEWDESEILSACEMADVIEHETLTAVETEEAATLKFASDGHLVNGEIREIVERTVKAAVARLAKAIVEEARNDRIALAAQLDAKVQQAVEAAITRLPSLQLKKSKRRI